MALFAQEVTCHGRTIFPPHGAIWRFRCWLVRAAEIAPRQKEWSDDKQWDGHQGIDEPPLAFRPRRLLFSYQQFLQPYQPGDEQQQAIPLEPWLMSLISDDEAASSRQEAPMVLQVPSGRKVYVTISCLPLYDAQMHPVGTVSLLHDFTHRYQKALHLQRVNHAVSTLREAIAHVPAHLDVACPEGTIGLLSPPVLFVAQQLVVDAQI